MREKMAGKCRACIRPAAICVYADSYPKRGAVSLHIAILKLAFSFISNFEFQKRSYQTKMHRLQKLAERFAQIFFCFSYESHSFDTDVFSQNFSDHFEKFRSKNKILSKNFCF